jgi:16S rRNA C967 or C1407 C5-methylase (RsmB/RsmF family)
MADILSDLEQLLAATPEHAYVAGDLTRSRLAAIVKELRRLRLLNEGLVRQLNDQQIGAAFQEG